jgi:biotin operon repressor
MVVGTNKRTVVRKKGRPIIDLKKKILSLLKNSENPLSTSDISSKLETSWHTIERNCLMLQISGNVVGFRVGKMNLWRII